MIKTFVYIHGIINHVRLAEELDLSLEYLFVIVQLPLLQELKQRKYQVPVQLWRYLPCQIVRIPHRDKLT